MYRTGNVDKWPLPDDFVANSPLLHEAEYSRILSSFHEARISLIPGCTHKKGS